MNVRYGVARDGQHAAKSPIPGAEGRPARPGAPSSPAPHGFGPGRSARFAAIGLAMWLAGCAAAPVPPTTWLRLSTEPPPADRSTAPVAPSASASNAATPTPGAPTATTATEVWQFMLPVILPGHLDRDGVFVPQGAAGAWVQPLAGARWIEPLRDAVPRVLREDVMRRLGGALLWWAPLPPGVVPTRQLRVEFVAFEIAADGRTLVTEARWTLADARGALPPAVHAARLVTPPAAVGGAQGWALAHREALAELAARIATTTRSPLVR